MSLLPTLNLLGRRVMKDHPDLNFGGCCVYAAVLGSELEKKGYRVVGKVAKPWYAETPHADIDKVRAKNNNRPLNHSEWNDNGVRFIHMFLEIRSLDGVAIHHDSEQTKKIEDTFGGREIYRGSMLIEHMQVLASNAFGWNDVFDRQEIPQLTETIKQFADRIQNIDSRKEKSWLSCLLGL